MSNFLILKEETQLSEELKITKDVCSLHIGEAFLEVYTRLNVEVLIFG